MECQFGVARVVSCCNEVADARCSNLTPVRVHPERHGRSAFLAGARISHPLTGIACSRVEIECCGWSRVRCKQCRCAFGSNGALSALKYNPEGEFVAERVVPDEASEFSPVEHPAR